MPSRSGTTPQSLGTKVSLGAKNSLSFDELDIEGMRFSSDCTIDNRIVLLMKHHVGLWGKSPHIQRCVLRVVE